MHKPTYFDYMATTPVDPRVVASMLPYLTENFGNPNSNHYYGYQAKAAVEEASAEVASLVNCEPKNIIWTSGATEANNLAIKGAADFYRRQGKHIVTCATEHKSVLDTCRYLESQGFEVTYLLPESDGLLDLTKFEKVLRQDTILVSIQHVNNEIGVIQDIASIGKITRARGILFHVDAAQSAGKVPIDLKKLPIDLMAFSAHKIYGPKGIGALYISSQPRIHITQQIHGGKQQNRIRAGTLAVHQIVGMGKAFKIAANEIIEEGKRQLLLREKLWDGIGKLGNIYINGSISKRIPGNLNISFADIDGELLLSALKDIAVSQASACIKKQLEPSYVLKAIGISNQLALNTIRFSLGRFTTELEIANAVKHITEVVTTLRTN